MRRPALRRSVVAAAAAALAAQSAPAAAERIHTYWRLEPVAAPGPATVDIGGRFGEQRLLPVRLVELEEAVQPGGPSGKTVPVGTLLYLVFNDDRQVGYCTLKDWSPGRQASTLFIPALDTRPCFMDEDRDGRFERSFSVFDKHGGPPTVRGSMRSPTPVAKPAAYRQVDPHLHPKMMRMFLSLHGKTVEKSRISVTLEGAGKGQWVDIRGVPGPAGHTIHALNAAVVVHSVEEKRASISVQFEPDVYIYSINAGHIFTAALPDFLRAP